MATPKQEAKIRPTTKGTSSGGQVIFGRKVHKKKQQQTRVLRFTSCLWCAGKRVLPMDTNQWRT